MLYKFWHLATITDGTSAFPPTWQHHPVAAVVLSLNPETWETKLDEIQGVRHRKIVDWFFVALEGGCAVSWYGRKFGFPIMLSEAFRTGVECAGYFRTRQYLQYGDFHLDLGEWTRYNLSRGIKLATLWKLAGSKRPDLNISELVTAGEWDKIKWRTALDVLALALAWTRYSILQGRLDLRTRADAVDCLARPYREAGVPIYQKFLQRST
jgi:hypothetical protein